MPMIEHLHAIIVRRASSTFYICSATYGFIQDISHIYVTCAVSHSTAKMESLNTWKRIFWNVRNCGLKFRRFRLTSIECLHWVNVGTWFCPKPNLKLFLNINYLRLEHSMSSLFTRKPAVCIHQKFWIHLDENCDCTSRSKFVTELILENKIIRSIGDRPQAQNKKTLLVIYRYFGSATLFFNAFPAWTRTVLALFPELSTTTNDNIYPVSYNIQINNKPILPQTVLTVWETVNG